MVYIQIILVVFALLAPPSFYPKTNCPPRFFESSLNFNGQHVLLTHFRFS